MSAMNQQKILSKLEADTRVVEYTPREFPHRTSAVAVEFVKYQAGLDNPDFKIDRVVSMTTGIAELEKVSMAERVQIEALERLKQLQEEAYRQGYDLGRDEGQESAYREKNDELSSSLKKIDRAMQAIENLKTELVKQNEASLVTLVYQIASKIAMSELKERPEMILPIILEAAAGAQDEENVVIKLSHADLDFLENAKERLGQDFEFVKRAKLEGSDEIHSGGCIIVTNFGQVDATIEKRLEKVWVSVQQKLPKTSDVIQEPSGGDKGPA
jgi:flagellar assembly protein FliH